MRLKLKLLKISAGKPVIFLHESSAKKMGIHTGDRVAIRKNGDIFVAIVDLARGLIKKNEVSPIISQPKKSITKFQDETKKTMLIMKRFKKINNLSTKGSYLK